MLQTGESENEILLGNKQLLAIFFVVVLLLGIAFAGGYKLGQGSKKTGADTAAVQPSPDSGAQTHEVGAGSAPDAAAAGAPDTNTSAATSASEVATPPPQSEEAPLGAKKHGKTKAAESQPASVPAVPVETRGEFSPQAGQLFLQVAAVGRDEAEAVADVLHKKGFRAHAVPKPGNAKIYRVLIGPLKDAADLSTTRDSLRRTGFREVITQRY
jgi:cell division septation protein DedD